jgi:hypothetical protein
MRLEIKDGDDPGRVIGAVVVRSQANGDIVLDFGPADGPAFVRLRMNRQEAVDLSAAVRTATNGDSETVLIVDD